MKRVFFILLILSMLLLSACSEWIPHDAMAERYNEMEKGVHVILHCGAGVVSVPAYETLMEKRPDIPELSYIAGSPRSIMEQYNEWNTKKWADSAIEKRKK